MKNIKKTFKYVITDRGSRVRWEQALCARWFCLCERYIRGEVMLNILLHVVCISVLGFGEACQSSRTIYSIREATWRKSVRLCMWTGLPVCKCRTLSDRKRLQCSHANLTSAACSFAPFLFSSRFSLSDTHIKRKHTRTNARRFPSHPAACLSAKWVLTARLHPRPHNSLAQTHTHTPTG